MIGRFSFREKLFISFYSEDLAIKPKIREELKDDYRVFYVTAWGYAADHLFGWFPKALNCHHDMFALLAHEGSRPKYLYERTRGERPSLAPYTEFLNDMGMTYSAIGDCYSYRASQMLELFKTPRYRKIPVVNFVRHPVNWLEFYVRWRSSNMRMAKGSYNPLEWEWKTANHGLFEALGLHSYSKNDIEIWSSYQGMFQLNNILSDIQSISEHIPIEKIANAPETFCNLVNFLSRGEIVFDKSTLETAYSMKDELFRGESVVECNPDRLLDGWPGWKIDSFRQLVSKNTMDAYLSFGYELKQIIRQPFAVKQPKNRPNRSIFVSSIPKSGTWLLRDILERMTGLTAYEPAVTPDTPADYENETLIDYPKGCFFSWHSLINPRTKSILISSQSKNIFLVRNIYDVLLSMLNHLVNDVDAVIGRSIRGSTFFEGKTMEECITLMISGFNSPGELNWKGAEILIRQIDSMLGFVEAGQALIIDYSDLTDRKNKTINLIASFLEIDLPVETIREIIDATSKDAMRERLKEQGRDVHVTSQKHLFEKELFLPYHRYMLGQIILRHAPELPNRLKSYGLGSIIKFENRAITRIEQSFRRNIVLLPAKSRRRKLIRFIRQHLSPNLLEKVGYPYSEN